MASWNGFTLPAVDPTATPKLVQSSSSTVATTDEDEEESLRTLPIILLLTTTIYLIKSPHPIVMNWASSKSLRHTTYPSHHDRIQPHHSFIHRPTHSSVTTCDCQIDPKDRHVATVYAKPTKAL